MEEKPLVTVIIPNYNHSIFLKERIESVLNQGFNNFEIILMDDCSSDDSRNILLEYKNNEKVSAILFNEKNSGSTFKQWEKGIDIARGKYIWIAESDDHTSLDFLDKLISFLESDISISVAFCKSNIVGENNKIISLENTQSEVDSGLGKESYVMTGEQAIARAFRHINIIPNASAVVFRKDAIDPIIFDRIKKMRFAGDWLFWVSLLENHKMAFVNEYLNNFRFHYQSTRGSKSVEDDIKRMYECLSVIEEINFKYNFDISTVKMSWLYVDWITRVLNRNKDYQEILKVPFKKNIKYYVIFLELFLKRNLKKIIAKKIS